MIRFLLTALAVWASGSALFSQAEKYTYDGLCARDRDRVDSVLRSMSTEEKVGQMFVPAVFLDVPVKVERALYWVDSCHIGGVSLYRNTPEDVVVFVNRAQGRSRIPLFTAMTFERGLAMRLSGAFNYPWPMTLGALTDDSLVQEVGRRVGLASRRAGVNYNFAPAADVNTDPQNPIIGVRSFGSDPHRVADKVTAFVRGMQQAGVLASVKHFPGHGDTQVDSHKALPVIASDEKSLRETELYPFEKAAENGVASIMTGHLSVPALDSASGRPSSLSEKIVGGVIRRDWDYDGLVITDALNMKGVADRYLTGQAEVEAIRAGNDLLLYSSDPETAYRAVLDAVRKGVLSEGRIEESVRRILSAKCAAGLFDGVPAVDTAGLRAELATVADSALCLDVMENAVTLIRNEKHALPLDDVADTVYYLPLGGGEHGTMRRYMELYAPVRTLEAGMPAADALEAAGGHRLVVAYHGADEESFVPKALAKGVEAKIDSLSAARSSVFVMLDNPYALLQFDGWKKYDAVLLGYQNLWAAQVASAEALFGAIRPQGKLPVTLDEEYRVGVGLSFRELKRLKYGFAPQEGIRVGQLAAVDSLLADIVSSGAAPGGRLVVARGGRVVLDKCFGTTMYDDSLSVPVAPGTIYDLASVTKVSATLPMIMKLYDEGRVKFSSRLGDMLPVYKGSDKARITLLEILSHNGGLPAGLPFYSYTLDKDTKEPSGFFYSPQGDAEYPLEVADGLYMHHSFPDTVTARIRSAKLKPKRMLYSDLDFYLLREVVDRFYPQGIEQAVWDEFYKPLGAVTMGYHPLERFPAGQIAPTVNDTWFRHQLLRGYVHDSGAALMGGVSGHAGNFSSAYDLVKYGQMLLQKGYYGGHRYLSGRTVEHFTDYSYGTKENSRSPGFVKKTIGGGKDSNDAFLSDRAYWHTGFTGTFLLVEPQEDLVYVLLTNRTYREKKPNAFVSGNYRFQILQAILQAIETPEVEK